MSGYKPYPNYKESGIRWLREVPNHWEILQSRRLFAERKERAFPGDRQLTASQKHGILYQDDFAELEGVKVMQVILGADLLKHVEPNDFVISMRTFQGGLEWSDLRGCISSAYVMLIPDQKIFAGYFKWAFKSQHYVQALQATSNLVRDGQALRFDNFAQVHLPVVPLMEQKSIAAFLDCETRKLDILIREQKELITLLQEKQQALISNTVTKGLNPKVKMKDSGVEWLEDVPEHWEVKRIRFLASMNPSKQEVAHIPRETLVDFLPMDSVSENGSLQLDKQRILSEVETGYTYFANEDVTYAKITPCFENGKGAHMQGLSGGFGFGTTELTVLRPILGQIESSFLWFITKTYEFRNLGQAWMYGAGGQKRVPDDFVRELKWVRPPLNEQKLITKFLRIELGKIDEIIAEANATIDLMHEHRASLISEAITGKIDVRHFA